MAATRYNATEHLIEISHLDYRPSAKNCTQSAVWQKPTQTGAERNYTHSFCARPMYILHSLHCFLCVCVCDGVQAIYQRRSRWMRIHCDTLSALDMIYTGKIKCHVIKSSARQTATNTVWKPKQIEINSNESRNVEAYGHFGMKNEKYDFVSVCRPFAFASVFNWLLIWLGKIGTPAEQLIQS